MNVIEAMNEIHTEGLDHWTIWFDECYPFLLYLSAKKKTYRKAFAITHAQENEQGTYLNVRINGLVITLIERSIFSNSPHQEVLNFLHNQFASESLSYFFLYPVIHAC